MGSKALGLSKEVRHKKFEKKGLKLSKILILYHLKNLPYFEVSGSGFWPKPDPHNWVKYIITHNQLQDNSYDIISFIAFSLSILINVIEINVTLFWYNPVFKTPIIQGLVPRLGPHRAGNVVLAEGDHPRGARLLLLRRQEPPRGPHAGLSPGLGHSKGWDCLRVAYARPIGSALLYVIILVPKF